MTDKQTILSVDSLEAFSDGYTGAPPVARPLTLEDFFAVDTADMRVVRGGVETDWVWTFAGPGHPQAVEYSNRIGRERLYQDRQKEQALVNGRKWKAPEEDVEFIRRRNIEGIVARLVSWTPIPRADGSVFNFSRDNALMVLLDPKAQGLVQQAADFIYDLDSFTKRSA